MDVGDLITMLERDESLELDNEEQTYNEEQETIVVDYERLFPNELENDGEDWDLYGDQWEIEDGRLIEDIARASIEGEEYGDFVDWPDDCEQKEKGIWDICAWYQPIHFFGYDWGIFIREDCLRLNAIRIASHLNLSQRPRNPHLLAKAALRASFLTFYLHEHYHHKVESFGFRLHVVQGQSSYLPYKANVYRPNYLTNNCLEEGLANASSYKRLTHNPYAKMIGSSVRAATKNYLRKSFHHDPPGYNLATRLLGSKFGPKENELKSQIKEAKLNPSKSPRDWNNAPDIMRPFFKIDQNIYTVVSKGRSSILPTHVFPKSCSTQDMIKIYENRGYETVSGGKGSHVKLKRPGSPTMVLPGNRKDLSSGVLKEALKTIGYKPNDLPGLLSAI